MRIQNLYYKLGGEKGGFLQTKWSGYCLLYTSDAADD